MLHRAPLLVALTALALFWAPERRASAEDAEAAAPLEALAAVESAYVEGLDAQAKQAAKRLAYGLRDEIYEHLLLFAPDHADARRWLKFKRNKEDTAWVRKGRYKRPRNMRSKNAKDVLAEYDRRWQTYLDEGVRSVLLAVEDLKDAPALEQALDRLASIEMLRRGVRAADGQALPPEATLPPAETVPALRRRFRLHVYQVAQRQGAAGPYRAARTALRTAYPEDAEVRVAIGEVQVEGAGWQLPETAAGLARRAAWVAKRDELKQRLPAPKEAPLDSPEIRSSMPEMVAVTTENIRVAGTGGVPRLSAIAHALEAAGPMFQATMGRAPVRRKGMTAFAFAVAEEIDTFLERYPGSRPELLKARKEHQLDITWMDARRMVVREVPEIGQIDLCLGLLLRMFVADTYQWKGDVPGWIDEGLCRYITFRLSGTRLTIAVDGRYAPKTPGGRNVPESHAPWLVTARFHAKTATANELRLVFGKRVDSYTARDAVLAYGLCTYLLECHPGSIDKLIHLFAKKTELDKAIRAVLGMPLGVFLVRWQQWLGETVPE